MNTLTKTVFALAVTTFLGSCSRPVANFQRSKAEHFYTAQTPATTVASMPTIPVEPVATAEAITPAPADASVQLEQALTQTEAYASANARPADARKLERKISKIREVLASAPQKMMTSAKTASKPTLVQRLMLKSMDKKIQKHLAPEQPQRSNTLTAGIIVALIGLLLLLVGGPGLGQTLGLIGLVIGIVLIILGLL